MTSSLSTLLPIDKYETERAAQLVALGFPEVEPVIPQILAWVQDLNWPVARVFQPFLAGIGSALAPYLRPILETNDDTWKYSLVVGVIGKSADLARALRPELERLALHPTQSESAEDLNGLAAEILQQTIDEPEA